MVARWLRMADWRNGVTAERQTAERLNGGTAEWRDRVMAEQQNGGTTGMQVFRCFHVRHQIYRTIIYPFVPLFFKCIAVTVQNSPFQIHIHTCIMENGKISKRPADSATAASKQSKKKGGHAKRMIVINRLRQDVVGVARVVSKHFPQLFPKLI